MCARNFTFKHWIFNIESLRAWACPLSHKRWQKTSPQRRVKHLLSSRRWLVSTNFVWTPIDEVLRQKFPNFCVAVNFWCKNMWKGNKWHLKFKCDYAYRQNLVKLLFIICILQTGPLWILHISEFNSNSINLIIFQIPK